MVQRSKVIDLRRSFLPTDPNAFPENLVGTRQEDYPEELVKVIPYEGVNFLPTDYGYRSYFGTSSELNLAGLSSRCSELLMFQNSAYGNILIALCEDGIWTSNPATASGTWTHEYTLAYDANVFKNWTFCTLNDTLYIYREGNAVIYKLTTTPTWSSFAPSFLTMTGQKGIFRAGGRLGMWDSANSVSWSSALDYTDFTPALTTLAGNTKFRDVLGNIVSILSQSDGFVIYSTKSIVGVRLGSSVTTLWDASVISNVVGVAYPTHVIQGVTDSQHFAFTNAGLYSVGIYNQISKSHAFSEILTEVTDFIREGLNPVRLFCSEGRYLFISLIDPAYIDGVISTQTSSISDLPFKLLGYDGITLPATLTSNQTVALMNGNLSPDNLSYGIAYGKFYGGGWDGTYAAEIDNLITNVGSYFTTPDSTTHWGVLSNYSPLKLLASPLSFLNSSTLTVESAWNTWDAWLSAFIAAQSDFVTNKVATPAAITVETFPGVGTYPTIPADPADEITEIGKLITGTGKDKLLRTDAGTLLNSEILRRYFTNANRIDRRRKIHYTDWNNLGDPIWVGGTIPLTPHDGNNTVAWNGSIFCYLALNSISGYSCPITSVDGINWIQQADTPLSFSGGYYAIIWNGTQFLAVGGTGVGVGYWGISADGISWTIYNDGGVTPDFYDVAWNGSVYCAVRGANAYISSNGIVWTPQSFPAGLAYRAITWNGTVFCATCNLSNIACTSVDGITWVQRTLPYSATWGYITSMGSLLCATGNSGLRIASSTDNGITWTGIIPSTPVIELTASSSVIVGVNPGNTTNIYSTSIDGINWIQHTLPLSRVWYIIGYGINKGFITIDNTIDCAFTVDPVAGWTLRGNVTTTFEATPITGSYGYAQTFIEALFFKKYQKHADGLWYLLDTIAAGGAVPPVFDNSYPVGLSNTITYSSSTLNNPLLSSSGYSFGEAPLTLGNPYVIPASSLTVTLPGTSFNLITGTPAPLFPTYKGALVLDIQLKKWGKFKGDHKLLLDYNPQNANTNNSIPYSDFGIRAGTLKTTGKISLFDYSPSESWIRYGKIGYYRLGMTQMHEVRADFRNISTGILEVETSLDGRNLELSLSNFSVFTQMNQVVNLCDLVGRWHTVKISGQWDLQYLEVRGTIAGRR